MYKKREKGRKINKNIKYVKKEQNKKVVGDLEKYL